MASLWRLVSSHLQANVFQEKTRITSIWRGTILVVLSVLQGFAIKFLNTIDDPKYNGTCGEMRMFICAPCNFCRSHRSVNAKGGHGGVRGNRFAALNLSFFCMIFISPVFNLHCFLEGILIGVVFTAPRTLSNDVSLLFYSD